MSHFCLLADPAKYTVGDVDLLADADGRAYWLSLFDEHFGQVLESAKAAYGRTHGRQIAQAGRDFAEAIAALRADPAAAAADGTLGVIELCRLREKALRAHDLDDPFRHVKQRENRQAADAYPQVVQRLGALPTAERWDLLVRGVFAGNIFDLGSPATMGYATDEVDFDKIVADIKPRPWLIDDFDALLDILPVTGDEPAPWAKAVILVDNAGADFVLGIMPLARQLASHGTQIVLAANERPSLNDITVDEAIELVEALAEVDEELASYVAAGLFEVVSTGNDIPLIDLSEVSDELNAAADDADLVIVEGMGRTVESNLQAEFAVDAIHLCLLKDPAVAARVDGEVFDCVCAYRPAEVADDDQAEGDDEADGDESAS